MAHSTVNAKGEFVVFDDDGKKMTKKALAQQQQSRVETRYPLGLYVTSDEDGTRHFWRGDDEITEDVWIQQHPHLRKGNDSGRNGSADSGNVGDGVEQGSVDEHAKAEGAVRQGIRDERAKASKGQRSGSPSHGVGQRQERSE